MFRKQEFRVSQIMELLNRSKNWVMKWPVLGETVEFIKVAFTGSHFNISESADDMKHYDVIMTSLPVEVPSGGETSSEERDFNLL